MVKLEMKRFFLKYYEIRGQGMVRVDVDEEFMILPFTEPEEVLKKVEAFIKKKLLDQDNHSNKEAPQA